MRISSRLNWFSLAAGTVSAGLLLAILVTKAAAQAIPGTEVPEAGNGAATALSAQGTATFTTVADFDGTNGKEPGYMSLVQGPDGDLYGTTVSGGANGTGEVFKVTPSGTVTTLHSFDAFGTEGASPYGGLVLATDGNFYGTAAYGGINYGTVFKITSAGTLTVLHSFAGSPTEGAYPYGTLVQGTDGNFYGTTSGGGASGFYGTVFKITPAGTLTTLHSFSDYPIDGAYPYSGLIQAANGTFYGTTESGGVNSGGGTVYSITSRGTLTTLYSFCAQTSCTDGSGALAGLVQASNGDFYGTTEYGGANDVCTSGCGTVFKVTLGGALTTLHSFDSTDGAYPFAQLLQATDGNFYGTTAFGANISCSTLDRGCGTLFKITSSGTLTTLYSFCAQTGCTDGYYPYGGLVQATNGTLYGTTNTGGASDDGTIFSLAVGLGPFVEMVPTSGKVGSAVKILGTDLTGATSVTFNGTAATFTVVSSSEIKTTVPSGATTGKVKVVTPSRTLTSNASFRVP